VASRLRSTADAGRTRPRSSGANASSGLTPTGEPGLAAERRSVTAAAVARIVSTAWAGTSRPAASSG
jgi:hypothetical protein